MIIKGKAAQSVPKKQSLAAVMKEKGVLVI